MNDVRDNDHRSGRYEVVKDGTALRSRNVDFGQHQDLVIIHTSGKQVHDNGELPVCVVTTIKGFTGWSGVGQTDYFPGSVYLFDVLGSAPHPHIKGGTWWNLRFVKDAQTGRDWKAVRAAVIADADARANAHLREKVPGGRKKNKVQKSAVKQVLKPALAATTRAARARFGQAPETKGYRDTADQPGRAKAIGVPVSVLRLADKAAYAASEAHEKHGGSVRAWAEGYARNEVIDAHRALQDAGRFDLPHWLLIQAHRAKSEARGYLFHHPDQAAGVASETHAVFQEFVRFGKLVMERRTNPRTVHACWLRYESLRESVPLAAIQEASLVWDQAYDRIGSQTADREYGQSIRIHRAQNPWFTPLGASFFRVTPEVYARAVAAANRAWFLVPEDSGPLFGRYMGDTEFVGYLSTHGCPLFPKVTKRASRAKG